MAQPLSRLFQLPSAARSFHGIRWPMAGNAARDVGPYKAPWASAMGGFHKRTSSLIETWGLSFYVILDGYGCILVLELRLGDAGWGKSHTES